MNTILNYEHPDKEAIVDLILGYGEEMERIERNLQAAVTFLETQGYTVEQVLQEREKENGTT